MTENARLILNFMKENPNREMTKQEIAAELSVSVQTVTGTMKNLLTKGYATERQEDIDVNGVSKVAKYVKITSAGLEYDPDAEEEAKKAEHARLKEEKARAREIARAEKRAELDRMNKNKKK